MVDRIKAAMGRLLARYLEKEVGNYQTYSAHPFDQLRLTLQPCDVLLVEGNTRISTAIKYLTRSSWSHAAFYVGQEGVELIEADLQNGVHVTPLARYAGFNTRICRPVGLTAEDRSKVIATVKASLGRGYDLKNVADLARYLVPTPPIPARFRRKMLALGSGDPTRAICSTLIAEAFQSVQYPILPEFHADQSLHCQQEILHIRHHSLFAPHDFDLSPYFQIVKPQIQKGFNYRTLTWDTSIPEAPSAMPDPPPALTRP